MKKPYKNKYQTTLKWLEVIAVLLIAFAILFITVFNTAKKQKEEIGALREAQNVIVILSTPEVMEQLENSNDSTIRWTIKK